MCLTEKHKLISKKVQVDSWWDQKAGSTIQLKLPRPVDLEFRKQKVWILPSSSFFLETLSEKGDRIVDKVKGGGGKLQTIKWNKI